MTESIITKPLHTWPRERTTRFRPSPFRSSYGDTMAKLRHELVHLRATKAIIELDITEADIRNDGWPRASAKVPPAVKLTVFTRGDNTLVYATDRFDDWHDNLRAIALGLEALRKIERYGIADDGEQYAGWRQLGETGSSVDSVAEAAHTMLQTVLPPGQAPDVQQVKANLGGWLKDLRRLTHPDAPLGSHEMFLRAQQLHDNWVKGES